MKINLHGLLSAEISDESAFHLVQFVRSLSLALESIYFDKMLEHSTRCEGDTFRSKYNDTNDNPF
jgi:hypothetical protein